MIANHILVSFHVAFISSVLSIPSYINNGNEVIRFMFISNETIISFLFMYITFHVGVAIHEMGHYLKAVRLNALDETLLPDAQKKMKQNTGKKILWYLTMFFKIPLGKYKGIKKTGLDYHPEAPYNLAVAASGPTASRNLALFSLPVAIVLISIGMVFNQNLIVYPGRLFLGMGIVGLLDFLLADPGKYREYKNREVGAIKAAKSAKSITYYSNPSWIEHAKSVADKMIYTRMQKASLPESNEMVVPWELRNCGMGGRHTEKEFPESNISLQESMFVPLSSKDYEDAQEMTLALQTRLKEIIENAEGCAVKGIGSEGGIAAYIRKEESDILPVQRLWRMQKQAILDCGYIPGKDVAMAIDPAASELEHAYREEKGLSSSEAVGLYLAWRDKDKRVLSRDDLLEVYNNAIEKGIPIISIEDGFAEDDDAGWKLIMDKLGDKIHVIGDDYITTKDSSIEEKAELGLINTALIKFNQIGTVTEGILAILTAKGKNTETVISHRSKSPIDDFEAHVALAANSLGLKVGGGSNSERLYKYESVVKLMREAEQKNKLVHEKKVIVNNEVKDLTGKFIRDLTITNIIAREAATNAGIPTVAVEVKVGIEGLTGYEDLFSFEGSTPLGTSYGTDEAVHLVDSVIPAGSGFAIKYPELFIKKELDSTFRFKKHLTYGAILEKNDNELIDLWKRVQRYNGKGCLNAVDNVINVISAEFIGKKVSELGDMVDIDRKLLGLELKLAKQRGVMSQNAPYEQQVNVMQRKCNLGMNAILSMSLALARLKGAMEGKKLWEILREEMNRTMSKTIAKYGGDNIFTQLREKIIAYEIKKAEFEKAQLLEKMSLKGKPIEAIKLTNNERSSIINRINQKIEKIKNVSTKKEAELWEIFNNELSFDELSLGLQIINEIRSDRTKLYEQLREQLPVYNINNEVSIL